MKKYSYFDVPTQVQFWDYTYGRYHGGIVEKWSAAHPHKTRQSVFWNGGLKRKLTRMEF